MLAKDEKTRGSFSSSETPAHITMKSFLAHYWPNHLGTRPNVSNDAWFMGGDFHILAET